MTSAWHPIEDQAAARTVPLAKVRGSIDPGYYDFRKINLNIVKLVPKSGPCCDGFGDGLPRGPFLPMFRTLIPSGLPFRLNASDEFAKCAKHFVVSLYCRCQGGCRFLGPFGSCRDLFAVGLAQFERWHVPRSPRAIQQQRKSAGYRSIRSTNTATLHIPSARSRRIPHPQPDQQAHADDPGRWATWEREIMLERQREGIAKAKAAGKYKGRPVSIDAAEIKRLSDELGPAAIAKRLGIARGSVYRVLGAA